MDLEIIKQQLNTKLVEIDKLQQKESYKTNASMSYDYRVFITQGWINALEWIIKECEGDN